MSIKILLCGGPGVGKSSFLQRLTSSLPVCENYSSIGTSIAVISMNFTSGRAVQVQLWEIAASMINNPQWTCETNFCDADAAILFVDAGSLESLKDIDEWLCLLKSDSNTSEIPKYLVVNKADSTRKVISPDHIDTYVSSEGIHDWFYTVGISELCDSDHSRGSVQKQSHPVDVLRKLLTLIDYTEKSQLSTNNVVDQGDFTPSSHPIIQLQYLYFMTPSSPVPLELYGSSKEDSATLGHEDGIQIILEYPNRRNTYSPSSCCNNNTLFQFHVMRSLRTVSDSKQNTQRSGTISSISREDSEVLLHGFPSGTFLVRNSFCEKELRISIKISKGKIVHTPVKVSRKSDAKRTLRCGRADLRGIDFDSMTTLYERMQLKQSQLIVII